MNRVAILAALFLTLCGLRASALEPPRADQESFITRAVFAEEQLWVLSDAGRLFRITDGRDLPREERLPAPSLDLCLLDGRPAVVACEQSSCTEWALRRWNHGGWSAKTMVDTEGDHLIALNCEGGKASVLTNRRFIEIDTPEPKVTVLSENVRGGPVSSVHATRDRVFVGINAGEWGGGLRRIDLPTGKVSTVESNVSGELCGGPLNSECDPVNGIADEPGHEGCLVVAVGLVHFAPHGRLVEVCGDRVRRLYFRPYDAQTQPPAKEKNGEPFLTVAFFGLVRGGETLWATGIDGIYRVEKDKVEFAGPLPTFRNVGGFQVSFERPDIVVVLTNVNQRHSLSGSVPIVVPRRSVAVVPPGHQRP